MKQTRVLPNISLSSGRNSPNSKSHKSLNKNSAICYSSESYAKLILAGHRGTRSAIAHKSSINNEIHYKAQITSYILLGLVLMVSISIALYLSAQQQPQPVEEITHIPDEAKPVHEFVTTCLAQTSREALVKLGMQGGYLYIPQNILRTPTAYLSLDQNNIFKLPYWYYDGEDRTPTQEFLQNQLTAYVLDNLKTCTQNFEKFEPETIQELEPPRVETLLTENDVITRLTWKLALTIGDRVLRIEDYIIRHPVRLKKIWELANAVMHEENKNSFFENRTIDFMASNENIPTDGLIFDCGIKKWRIPDLKKELQTILQYNLPSVRVENTAYLPFQESRNAYRALANKRDDMLAKLEQGIELDQQKQPVPPDDAYEYFKLTLNAGNARTDLKASFSYQPEWGMLLSAQPNDGTVLKSNLGKGVRTYLPFLCINQWHFTYTVIYPVKLTIKDDKAFLNKGYLFSMAFPVVINNNAPARDVYSTQKFPLTPTEADFCTTPSDQIADIRAKGFIEDTPIAVELPDANITYTCFTQYCELGQTRSDDGYYRLRTALPQGCNNPRITAAKEGYLPSEGTLTGDKLELVMTRLKKVNVTITAKPYNLQDKKYLESVTELPSNHHVALHLYLRNSSFDQYLEYPRDREIEIVEGKASYDIDAILTSNGQTIGGYSAEAINFTYADIADKNTLAITVLETRPHPASDQQRGEMTQFLYTNEAYKKELKPRFT